MSATPIDAAAVTAAFRERVRPQLRAAGFTEFTGRRAWAQVGPAVWCLAITSFGPATAFGVGCTTASFRIDLGVHFHRPGDAAGAGTGRPKEAGCVLRFTCHKQLHQPFFRPYGRTEPTDRSDVWYVMADGSNLETVVEDARAALFEAGLPQLEACSSPADALERLQHPGVTVNPRVTEFDVAPHGSPRWQERVDLLSSLV